MNKDQITGKLQQTTGKVKEAIGEAVGSERLANRGLADQANGAARESWGSLKRAAGAMAERRHHDAERRAAATRTGASNAIQDPRDRLTRAAEAQTERERVKDRTA